MKAFCLCLETNFTGKLLDKWNTSSYFKVVMKSSQLIELDCGYCILFTKRFTPDKKITASNFTSVPGIITGACGCLSCSQFFLSCHALSYFICVSVFTCVYLPLSLHIVGYTTDDLQFMWQTGDPVQMDAIALPQFDIKQEDIDYGNCTKFYAGTGRYIVVLIYIIPQQHDKKICTVYVV